MIPRCGVPDCPNERMPGVDVCQTHALVRTLRLEDERTERTVARASLYECGDYRRYMADLGVRPKERP